MKLKNTIKSIAIGSFDGMHVAHQTLIEQVEAIVIIERNGGYLTPGHKRSFYTSKMCCFYHFDKIRSLNPEAFVHKLKEDFPHLEKIVVGYDFAFGKAKAGNADHLNKLFDGEVCIIKEVCVEGIPVHSRTIKAYLKKGNIALANKLLGRAYVIEGEVIKGQGLGKKELVPTLNLSVDHYQLPLEGVYATRTKIGEKWLSSVSFLGHRVTTDSSFAVEVHVIDRDIGEVSGMVSFEFVAFIRENQKFDGLNTLKKQIEEDIARASELSSKRNSHYQQS
ncbi:bifunctional riboflavin kinase/FAD synthetase [Sulfurovum sp.]|uniref:bifunctional riboflavin kinase/FAD synthetase n=2 Tax=Sulfurovum sp. TaxID=1969726 RepID=UPI0025EBC8E0|nr:bifunctional riboflavin kinase/FAD synthetase [Sulfurovum sp.]